MFFSFKTVGQLQVIYQPLSGPKQIRAREYAVGRRIGLERVKVQIPKLAVTIAVINAVG
jgi:hypothetical protein